MECTTPSSSSSRAPPPPLVFRCVDVRYSAGEVGGYTERADADAETEDSERASRSRAKEREEKKEEDEKEGRDMYSVIMFVFHLYCLWVHLSDMIEMTIWDSETIGPRQS